MDDTRTPGSWTLLTGHGHVLVELARTPEARMRDIADAAGVTERAALAIVADLEAAGYVKRERVGRRNRYTVNHDAAFRHTAQDGLTIGPLLALLARPRGDAAPARTGWPASADDLRSSPTDDSAAV